MPQQYSNRRPHREGRTAESGPAGLGEGQRRSGGGDAHGPLPVHKEAKGGPPGLEFGWHHEAEFALVPKLWGGSVYFSPRMRNPREGANVMAKMTPRTLSGFMELLAPQKAPLSPGTP